MINREKNTILAFLIVGVFTAGIYFGLFALFWQIIGSNYKISFSIAYSVAILFHFFANRRFTFKAHGTNLFAHIFKYTLMISINYLITFCIMQMVVEWLHLTPYIGISLAIVINMTANFLISRYWVFLTSANLNCRMD